VIRTTAAEIKQSGRQTMGVRLVNLAAGQTLVAIARNAEEPVNGSADGDGETAPEGAAETPDEAGDDGSAESSDS
jgi:DNA gyrase subunit A